MNSEGQLERDNSATRKPSVFVSYAHKDGTETARRIVRSLEPYCSEVFWDWKLRVGDWRQQLATRIQSHEFFLVVMSPAQANSEVCKWELQLAQKRLEEHDGTFSGIVPIKRFTEHEDEVLERLQYADFSQDFGRGFGDLTQIMFGVRRTAWENLASQPPQELLAGIQHGQVPALIVFECCERLIVEKIWNHLHNLMQEMRSPVIVGNPQSPEEMLNQVELLVPQMATRLDSLNMYRLKSVKELLEAYMACKAQVVENDHEAAGQCASDLIAGVRRFLTMDATGLLNAWGIANINANFDSDVAGIFQEVLRVHARAMRLMY
jgi:hypothetical protein